MTVRALRCALPAGLLLASAVAVGVVLSTPSPYVDLVVYRAGGYAWTSGIPLYGPEFPLLIELIPLPFTYPPIAAVLFAGLAQVPFSVALAVLTTLGVLSLVVTAWLTAQRLESDRWRVAVLAAAAIALGVLTEPVQETLTFGQVNLLLMALVTADCLLPRTPWPRGTLIGIAAAIKLTPAVFLLFFVAHRQWRPVLVAGAAFVVATVAGFLAAPRDSIMYWLGGVLTDPTRIGSPGFPSNQSLAGLLHRSALPESWHTLVWGLAVAAVLAAGWAGVRRLRSHGLDVPALLVVAATGLLASPVSWSHHYVWVVPALVWCAWRAMGSWRWWPALVGLAAVFTVAPHWLVGTTADHVPDWSLGEQLLGSGYVWVGLLVVGVAVTWPLAQPAGNPQRPAGHLDGRVEVGHQQRS